ncbi:serine hydrolase domain-containing protein [Streptomyces sp. NBC_00557]|uniref:serine hydrolase domain-containing protein n=1 Tax=Streptomyces sp. NBC_00557 TaxID=2975776 RepID=UPI002E81032E|nr:serine hydrolase domain-containing protein [Streptomyces sp. NBC_00557]WUC36948.1 beta-lactamase family protein [Streptomyces sp. NBC_00557]
MRVRTTLVAATAVLLTAALAAPAAATAGDHGHAATGTALQAAVAAGVPGVTATAEDGHGTWSATAGVGDIGTGRPRSAADRYRVGSITKTFVATVLLQLEAEGRLSLDDTVDEWLPGVVRGHGHDGRHITVRQLLNHTSGVFDYTSDPGFYRSVFTEDGFLRHRYDTHTPGELVRTAMRHRPDFAPGASWKYSNTNYVLAGMVIEKVTGHPYATEIERRIIAPLRLRGTSVPGTRSTVPRPSSRAYSKFTDPKGPARDVTELNPSLASAAGEMISDSADLDRFYSALLRGKLLPPRQLTEMRTTVEATGIPGARYGLGIMDTRLSCGVHVWGHNGGIHGSQSSAVTTADGEHAIAFNFNGDWAGDPESVIDAEFC